MLYAKLQRATPVPVSCDLCSCFLALKHALEKITMVDETSRCWEVWAVGLPIFLVHMRGSPRAVAFAVLGVLSLSP